MTQTFEPIGAPEIRDVGTAATPAHDRVSRQIAPGEPLAKAPKTPGSKSKAAKREA